MQGIRALSAVRIGGTRGFRATLSARGANPPSRAMSFSLAPSTKMMITMIPARHLASPLTVHRQGYSTITTTASTTMESNNSNALINFANQLEVMTRSSEANFKKGARSIQEFTRSTVAPLTLEDYHKLLQLVVAKIVPKDVQLATNTAACIFRHMQQRTDLKPTAETMALCVQCATLPKMPVHTAVNNLLIQFRKAYLHLDINIFNTLLQIGHEEMQEDEITDFISHMRECQVPPDETTFELIEKTAFTI